MQTDSTCTVFGADGAMRSWSTSLDLTDWAPPPSATATIASDVPIAEIMATQVVCAREDLKIEAVARLIVDHHIGCVPIVDDRGHPIGIVTKADLVERLDGRPAAGPTNIAADVMMPLAITLDERASVADAASMFVSEDFHHVMIVSSVGVLVGVVSTKDVVRWLYDNDRAARRE